MRKIGPTPEEHAKLEEQARDLHTDLNDDIVFWDGKSDFIVDLSKKCLNQLFKLEGLRRRHFASEDIDECELLRKEIKIELHKLSDLLNQKEQEIENYLRRN